MKFPVLSITVLFSSLSLNLFAGVAGTRPLHLKDQSHLAVPSTKASSSSRPTSEGADRIQSHVNQLISGSLEPKVLSVLGNIFGDKEALIDALHKRLTNLHEPEKRARLQEAIVRLNFEEDWGKLNKQELEKKKKEVIDLAASTNTETISAQLRLITELLTSGDKQNNGAIPPTQAMTTEQEEALLQKILQLHPSYSGEKPTKEGSSFKELFSPSPSLRSF